MQLLLCLIGEQGRKICAALKLTAASALSVLLAALEDYTVPSGAMRRWKETHLLQEISRKEKNQLLCHSVRDVCKHRQFWGAGRVPDQGHLCP